MMCAEGQPEMVAPQAVQALEKDPRSWMRVCLSRGRVDANKFDTVKNGEGVLHVRTWHAARWVTPFVSRVVSVCAERLHMPCGPMGNVDA